MRKTAIALVVLCAAWGFSSTARAEQPIKGIDPGKLALAVGLVVGGGVGYFVAEDLVGAAVGAAVGGLVGHWWHGATDQVERSAMNGAAYVEGRPPLLRLIALPQAEAPGAGSPASD